MKTVTKHELASEILPKLVEGNGEANDAIAAQAEWASKVLDQAFTAILTHLKDGSRVELDDFLSLSVTKPQGPELREDDDSFFAYAPISGTLKAEPIGTFARTLQHGRKATVYYLTNYVDRFAEVLTHHFRKRGWNMVIGTNAVEALSRIDTDVPYTVLIEGDVPGLQDLVRGIKCNAETNGVPVLIIGEPSGENASFAVRHDETIEEPFDVLDVLEKLEDRLATRVATIDEQMLTLAVTVPGSTAARRHTCSLVTEMLVRAGMDAAFAQSTTASVNELLTNAHIHGHRGNEHTTTSLRVLVDPRRLMITVKDQGEGFEHTAVMAEARNHKADPNADHGLLRVLRGVDRIEFNKPGTEVVVTRFRR